jgi:predicted RNA methylase
MDFNMIASYTIFPATIYLLVKRRKYTIERSNAIAKLQARLRGRKIKIQTDEKKAKNLKNRDPNYMAPFNPSVDDVVNNALDMLQLCKEHVLWDLGCGDGRLLVEACVKHGCMARGVEYDKDLCQSSKERAKNAGVATSVEILHDNILNVDFSSAQRMYLFLLPDGLKKLTPKIRRVLENSDARIVTYAFSVVALKPVEIRDHKGTKLYLYTADSL